MAKTNEEILEALLGLSPDNDEHWTADGLPRLDAVENLLGASVTRKQLTNAAPDFNRAMAQSVVEEAASQGDDVEQPDADKAEPDADPQSPEGPSETDTVTAGTGGPEDFDPLAEGPGDEEDMLDASVQDAQDRVSTIQLALEQGRLALAEAEQALADAAKAKNSAFPPLSAAEAIQQFQRSEHEKRAAARGVVLGSVASPIDAALKARRTNQGRRTPDLFSTTG